MNFYKGYKNLNSICQKKSEKAILLKLNYNNTPVKIIYCHDAQNLIICIEANKSAWFLEKRKSDTVSTFIPEDIFIKNKSIVYDYYTNSVQPFFKHLYEYVCSITEGEVLKAGRKDIYSLLSYTSTNDEKIHEGRRPYFHCWCPKTNMKTSKNNLEKTKRYFGEEIMNLCSEHNISSVWRREVGGSSYDFLNLAVARDKLQVIINNQCPLCGTPLEIKKGRNGQFLSCSAYPNCKYARDVV